METKILTRTAFLIALATVLSFIKLSSLPMGGSITLFSMLCVVLIGYYYGPMYGLLGGFIYGLLQLLLGGYILSIPQVIVDYVFAFTALGLGAFFKFNTKLRLHIVYTIGVLGRYIFACISGYLFFAEYAGEGQTILNFTMTYNATYIIPEYIITMIIISIPILKKTLDRLNDI